jgi:hypothetical protein
VVGERTAAAWIARAQEVTLRRLADEVDWALAARDGLEPVTPPPPDAHLDLAERQMCSPGTWAPCDDHVTFVGPAAVVGLLRAAVAAFARPSDVPWQGLERLLRHVTAEWEARPRHRDPIFARDGWRCAVPACTSWRNLHDHHLLFRSRGGGNARDNRITICVWHHLRHSRRARAGLGSRADEGPLGGGRRCRTSSAAPNVGRPLRRVGTSLAHEGIGEAPRGRDGARGRAAHLDAEPAPALRRVTSATEGAPCTTATATGA